MRRVFFFSFLLIFIVVIQMVIAYDLHVNIEDASCSDSYTRIQASTALTPWCTLQNGLSNLTSGDRLILHGGTYNNQYGFSLSNKNFSTLTEITCVNGEECLITQIARGGYNTTPNSMWTNVTTDQGNTWRTSFSTGNSWLAISRLDTNESFFVYDDDFNSYFLSNNLEEFNNSGNPSGSFFDTSNDFLYLRFDDPTENPNNIPIGVSEINGNFILTNVSNLLVESLTFKYGREGIRATRCHNCNFSNNIIQPIQKGIYVLNSAETFAYRNQIFRIPMKEYYWYWQISTGIRIYNSYENNKVVGNRVTNFFDGIQALGEGYLQGRNNRDLLIKNNAISIIYDDGIELENYHNNGTVTLNNVSSAYVAISLIPFNSSGSPSIIEYNIFLPNRSILLNSSHNATGYCYKQYRSGSSGTQSESIINRQNTCYGWGYAGTVQDKIQKNINHSSNLFVSNGSVIISFTGQAKYGINWDYNLYYHPNMSKPMFGWYNNLTEYGAYKNIEQAISSSDWDGTWDLNSKNVSPGIDLYHKITSLEQLRPTSGEVCTMSSTGSYVGALPCRQAIFNGSDVSLHRRLYDLAGAELIIDGITLSLNGTISNAKSMTIKGTLRINGGGVVLG